MIALFQNNKLIAIDKDLLNLFNTDLTHLSEIISEIEINVAALKNENINILSKTFKVKEIPLLSLNNIKAFDFISTETNFEENLIKFNEETSVTEPLFEETTLQTPQNEPSFEEISTQTQQTEITELESLLQQASSTEETQKEKLPLTLEEKDKEIVISFENDLDEISKILSLDSEEAKKLIEEDLLNASKDLGIEIEPLKELFNELLSQIEKEKNSFKQAIKDSDYEKLHKISHFLKGAALNLRLSNIALILKTIDEQSKQQEPIEKIEHIINQFYLFIDKIKQTENKPQSDQSNQQKINIPEPIKNLIIQTIKEYLATQNEKKFKKDLKYIEKILNTKINSLEDLQNLVKV